MTGRRRAAGLAALLWLLPFGLCVAAEQLVFGSFRSEANARAWAGELQQTFAREFEVERVHRDDGIWFRVRSPSLGTAERDALQRAAAARDMSVWVIRGTYERPGTVTSSVPPEVPVSEAPTERTVTALTPAVRPPGAATGSTPERAPSRRDGGVETYADIDVGLQTRTYPQRGLDGQDRFQPSVSVRLEYHRAWDDGRSSATLTPFLRLDAEDDERSHADLREAFYTRVGDAWEVHAGVRQIFWGVAEFNHLVDIVNQTDLVENIDGEDKLGQPMVQLSLVRDWGIVDLFLLGGFRERTFPGEDGRLRGLLPVDGDDARYASGAGRNRVDGAVRWSHHVGPLNFGVHHFSGTGREPRYLAEVRNGSLVLIPEYHVIDQTGFDGQALFGDWAWKVEAITRSGDGDRFAALTAGFERTLVGVFGSRADLGLVAEYMYDERDEVAFNTLFEHDLALGTRWRSNDLADTTALLGVIWDVDTDEYVISLEASRRFGSSWQAVLEGRVFAGAPGVDAALAPLQLLDGEFKSRSLQDDDYVQLELTRFF
ncbi:MAG: SPOR domain-containing protein [Pseudomonadales bacterium]